MNSWDKGYVSEIDYTYGYYTELNPYKLMFAVNYLGYKAPVINTACELGFGQGVSLNINAASQPIDWYGCDFNPSQASFAKDLGKFSGIAENIFEDDFEAFLDRPDLPNFDYICLHGIWSWVSEDLRHVLLDFLRKYLNPGGLVYISYNSLAQFSELVPLRNLMKYNLDNCEPKSAPISQRIEASLDLVKSLQKTDPKNIQNSKTLESRLTWISKLDKNYLAHEYFNDSWYPFSFSQISSHLKQAKLSFLTSAFFPDSLDALNFNASQLEFLSKLTDPVLVEECKDLILNRSFRRDIWIRGSIKLSPSERIKKLSEYYLSLNSVPEDIDLKVKNENKEANLQPEIYSPILLELSKHSYIKLENLINGTPLSSNLSERQIIEAVFILIGKGVLNPCLHVTQKSTKARCRAINNHFLEASQYVDHFKYFASSNSCGAILVSKIEQLFLLALSMGHTEPKEVVDFVIKKLKAQSQKLSVSGTELKNQDQERQELAKQFNDFNSKRLKFLKQRIDL